VDLFVRSTDRFRSETSLSKGVNFLEKAAFFRTSILARL